MADYSKLTSKDIASQEEVMTAVKSSTDVNKHLRKIGNPAVLRRSPSGYYYFTNVGPNHAVSSGVYTYRASSLSLEQWMKELKEKEEEAK